MSIYAYLNFLVLKMSLNIYYRNTFFFYFHYLNINNNLNLLYNKYNFYNKMNLNLLHKYFHLKIWVLHYHFHQMRIYKYLF